MRESIILDTLGKLADQGFKFGLYCEDCHNSTTVSCESVAERLGRDHSYRVAGKFRCTRCGSRNVGVHNYPPTDPPKDRMW